MTSPLEEHISTRLAERGRVFVFPSEVVASFWRRRALTGPTRAVREDRFLSWDAFKELHFARSDERRPANRLVRALFLDRLVDEIGPEGGPVTLLPPAHRGHASLRSLERLLPRLAALLPEHREPPPGSASPLMGDLIWLRRRYGSFLEENGLFEPAAGDLRPEGLPPTSIVYPGLIDDWGEFGPALTRGPAVGKVSVLDVPSPVPTVPFEVYPNTYDEIRGALGKVADLLSGGVDPDGIVVTLGDYDSLAPRLQEEARIRDIPLALRSGVAFDRYPVGRFFHSLGEAPNDYSALRRLLLDRAVPWRDREDSARLVRLATDFACLRTSRAYDGWRYAFRRGVRDVHERSRLQQRLTRLVRSMRAITTARSFEELRSALYSFLSRFIDGAGWAPADEAVFQRSASLLLDLVRQERILGFSPRSPWTFFLQTLAERRYVLQTEPHRVAVYPYRVAAGIEPEHHLVLGVSDSDARVVAEPASMLPEDERERLGAAGLDQTSAFLDAYRRPGAVLSYAARTGSGTAIAPPGMPEATPAPGHPDGFLADPYMEEEAWFFRGLAPATPAAEVQLAAARRTAATEVGGATRSARLHGRNLRLPWIPPRLYRDGMPVITATRLSAAMSCGLRVLYADVLELEEADFDPILEDPRRLGRLHHQVLERLYLRIAETDGIFDPERIEEYRSWAASALQVLLDGRPRDAVVLSLLEADVLSDAIVSDVAAVLDWDGRDHAGYRIGSIEESLEIVGDGYLLRGRIDRTLVAPDGGHALVDYKRNLKRGAGKRLLAESPAEERDYQMPVYLLLEGQAGRSVTEAAYFNVSEGRPFYVLGPEKAPLSDEANALAAEAATQEAITDYLGRLEAGDFAPRNGDRGCEGCGFRALCRMCYTSG